MTPFTAISEGMNERWNLEKMISMVPETVMGYSITREILSSTITDCLNPKYANAKDYNNPIINEISKSFILIVPLKEMISPIYSRILGKERNLSTDIAASVTSVGISALICQVGRESNMKIFLTTQGVALGLTVGKACLSKGLEFINQKIASAQENAEIQ